MKDRLKKKLKAKKLQKDNILDFPSSAPKPVKKKEYEMPEEYRQQLLKLVEMIKNRDDHAKEIPNLPLEDRRKAQVLLNELSRAIDNVEQRMAEEYESYQKDQHQLEVSYATDPEDSMSEEYFIRVKHLQPHIFEDFAEHVTEGMTEDERAAQYAIIARREAEELDDILTGRKNALPYENLFIKHRLPDHWMPELLLEIINGAYETDDFFEINYDALKRAAHLIFRFSFDVNNALPVQRRNMEEAVLDLRRQYVAGAKFLLEHAEKALANGDFLLKERALVAEIEKNFETLDRCREWKYVVIKHTEPEKLEEYVRLVTEDFSAEETEAFLKSAAESGEKDADTLLTSLEYERLNAERVAAYRASRPRKIEGAQLSPRRWQRFEANKRRREEKLRKDEAESNESIEFDLPERLAPYLKAFRAVTGDRIAPARYEDEQSRKDEEISRLLDEAGRNSEKLFIIIKHQFPEKFEEFEKTLEPLSRKQKQDFYARIAHLEATRLNDILEGKD